jgi:hypothetical protein
MKITITLLLVFLSVGVSSGEEACKAVAAGQGLEGLSGSYGDVTGEPMQAAINVDGFMSDPTVVTIRLNGRVDFGLRRCGDNDPRPVEVYEFTAMLTDKESGHSWVAMIPVQWNQVGDDCLFGSEKEFQPVGGEWSYAGLDPANLRLSLTGNVAPDAECEDLKPYSKAEISSASLITVQLK